MTTLSRPSASRGPLATPSPSYNINFGYDFGAAFSGSEKVVAVAYLARANRRGRITAAWFMPNTGTGGYYLYGFVGKVSGDVAARTNGVQKYQYEYDGAPDAGSTPLTRDLGIGGVVDIILGDPTNVGQIPMTGSSGTINCGLPLTQLAVGGPGTGPLSGKDAVPVSTDDFIAIVVVTSSVGNGVVQAQTIARPFLEDFDR